MNNIHTNEDYLESSEFKIQRYEDEIPELFHKAHDNYMSGMVNANTYAEALATIHSALDEIGVSLDESLYVDNSGIMGNVGEKYTAADLKQIWENGKDDDPSMMAYTGNYDRWLRDTIEMMSSSDYDDDFDLSTRSLL